MSLPARITDLQPLATILSGELDNEFNNLVNILNGTDQTKNIRVRSNDNSFAVARFDQLGSSANIVEFYSGGVEVGRVEKDGDLVVLGLTGAAGIYTFTSIPLGPNADPTTDNQLGRKLYIDTRRNRWSANFFIADVTARGIDGNFEEIQGVWIPGANFVATHIGIKASAGTASGSFSIEIRKQPHASQSQTTLGTLTLNPGAIGTGVEVDISDHAFAALDWVYPVVTALSSSLHKSVWIGVRGFQTPQNP